MENAEGSSSLGHYGGHSHLRCGCLPVTFTRTQAAICKQLLARFSAKGSRVTPITGASLTCFPASSGRWLRTCHLFYCCCLRAGHVLINAPLRAIHMLVQHSSKHPASAESPRSGVSYFPSTFLLVFFWKGRGSTKGSQVSVAHIEISTAILRPSRRDRSIPVTENCPHKHF